MITLPLDAHAHKGQRSLETFPALAAVLIMYINAISRMNEHIYHVRGGTRQVQQAIPYNLDCMEMHGHNYSDSKGSVIKVVSSQ